LILTACRPGATSSRSAFLISGLILSLLMFSRPGAAQGSEVVIKDRRTDQNGRVEAVLQPNVSTDAASLAKASVSGPRLFWVAIPKVSFSGDVDDGNEGFCRGWRYVAGDTQEEADQIRWHGFAAYQQLWVSLIAWELPGVRNDVDCPVDPVDQVPIVVVRDAVRGVAIEQLPRPTPEIPPGKALTGLPAFLVTAHDVGGSDLAFGPVQTTVDLGLFTATVEIEAHGTTTVDWGDGTVTSHTVVGTPWPDGQVRHTYTDKGTVTVTVTDHWQVEFRVIDPVSITDTVTAELQAVAIDDFPVREYRAVRVVPDS